MDLSGEGGTWVPCGRSHELSCHVEGLECMHEYLFRVKAVNSEGDSEPLEGTDPVLAKNPFDPPGPPGKPGLKDWDWDHFELKWAEPRHDGGSRITGYIIEKRSAQDDLWLKCGEVKPKLEFGIASEVELGKSYVLEGKFYPRERSKEPMFRGRFKVQLKQSDGELLKEEFPSRDSIMVYLAEKIPLLKHRVNPPKGRSHLITVNK